MPRAPFFRLARAALFAAVCVTLGVAGHSTAAHGSVPALAVVAGLAGLTVLAAVLAGAERSLGTILAGLLGGQFMLHALFAYAEHGGRHLAHHPVLVPAGGAGSMTLAHLAAAAVSACWLRRGERAVWRLARLLAAAARRRSRMPTVPALPSPAPGRWRRAGGAGAAPRERLLWHVVVRRGPPSPSPTFVPGSHTAPARAPIPS